MTALADTPAAKPRRRALPYPAVLTLLTGLLLLAALTGLALGSVRVPPGEVLAALTGSEPTPLAPVIWNVRLPRVLLAVVVGAGLAVAGTVLQALVRNPLADPFLLGASSGASTGAVLVIVAGVGTGLLGTVALPVAAFAGSMGALVAVYAMARRGGTMTTGRLILAGVAVQYILSALTTEAEHARAILFWTLGGLGGARWDSLFLPAAVLIAGTGLLLALSRPLDLLLAGEEGATVLGLDTHRFRAGAFVLASLVTGVLVAVSGAIGFIGLMVPHAARLLAGAGHRRLLPVTALGGALFLVVADLVARTVAAPEEIPVGVITALTGGPFFLWLLRRSSRGEGVTG
ncbi:iron ABC transporter permease [Streptomyces sp. T7(2022)]|uniref:FecCD family ABC transporter permease n=1 Tax=Streptomyces sp. T7(2022) TaxID=2916034 RepID=UPI001EE3EBE9|nr:iron ABC transporter permease [Streptomyces sp. T7(2022)]MCG5119767.1 iron ABC transporter permease [Streptomyces sp. T7(2022)]